MIHEIIKFRKILFKLKFLYTKHFQDIMPDEHPIKIVTMLNIILTHTNTILALDYENKSASEVCIKLDELDEYLKQLSNLVDEIVAHKEVLYTDKYEIFMNEYNIAIAKSKRIKRYYENLANLTLDNIQI